MVPEVADFASRLAADCSEWIPERSFLKCLCWNDGKNKKKLRAISDMIFEICCSVDRVLFCDGWKFMCSCISSRCCCYERVD